MIDLEKWNQATAAHVKRILDEKQLPCVGFSLIFIDFLDKDNLSWKWVTRIAFDPDNPIPEADRKRLQDAFDQVAVEISKILEGDIEKGGQYADS